MTINIHILFESCEYTVMKAANFSVLLVLPRKHKKSLATVTRLCRLIHTIFIIIFCLFFGKDSASWLHLINLPLNPPNILQFMRS